MNAKNLLKIFFAVLSVIAMVLAYFYAAVAKIAEGVGTSFPWLSDYVNMLADQAYVVGIVSLIPLAILLYLDQDEEEDEEDQ